MRRTHCTLLAILLALASGACDDEGHGGARDGSVGQSEAPDARSSPCYSPVDPPGGDQMSGAEGCECIVTQATRTGYCSSQGSGFLTCGAWRAEEPGARRQWSRAADGPCAPQRGPSADECIANGGVLDASAGGYAGLPRAHYDGGVNIGCAFPIEVLAENCTRAGLRVMPANATCARRGFIVGDDAGARICCE